MADIEAELLALVDGFDAAKVPYALCGALALAVHGHPRATRDIDIIVPGESVPDAKAVAKACGFRLEALPMTFQQSGMKLERVSKIVDRRPLMLDVLIGNEVLAPVWESRVQMNWNGRTIWCVSREGLVSMKLAAGRPQDLADIASLEESA